ncbi:MAG: hypothetical protein GKR91_16645 [Pseudomonadales bacterium]|nr:hypothetical protein [Pseudomonadales bacterium]
MTYKPMIAPHFFDNSHAFLKKRVRFLGILLCLWVPLLNGQELQAQEVDAASVVGEVSLVLGRAFIVKANDSRQQASVGIKITVSDKIETDTNGHVHIRFIDDALVSVRPNSQFEIVRYDFNASNPEDSTIKFNLIEGVSRSISGEGARSSRGRFRLNTPIAAIGVRGTDFVVRATAETTRALVNEGTIVVAPYSEGCSEAAFGPCSSNAVALTESRMQEVALEGEGSVPRVVPATHEREPDSIQAEVQLALNDSDEKVEEATAGTEVYLESVTSVRATEAVEEEAAIEIEANAIPDFTPEAPIDALALTDRQLVWGRWADGIGGTELITLPYLEAREGRKVAVGNTDYALFRTQGPFAQVDEGLTVVSFNLDSAQAFYDSESGIVAMQVSGGSLDIDFVQSLFSTELNLLHDFTGNVNFVANGTISDRGYFNAIEENQRLSGAVSQDATEAGYFFEKQLEIGSIQGLTLWNSN